MTITIKQTPLLDCGHEPTMNEGIGTGTARNSDGKTMCYGCAYIETMDQIVMAGISLRNDQADFRLPFLYMDSTGLTVTTWDGQFIGHVTHHGRYHNFAGSGSKRHYIDVRIEWGADVVNAYGVGAPGEYCVLTRRKGDTA